MKKYAFMMILFLLLIIPCFASAAKIMYSKKGNVIIDGIIYSGDTVFLSYSNGKIIGGPKSLMDDLLVRIWEEQNQDKVTSRDKEPTSDYTAESKARYLPISHYRKGIHLGISRREIEAIHTLEYDSSGLHSTCFSITNLAEIDSEKPRIILSFDESDYLYKIEIIYDRGENPNLYKILIGVYGPDNCGQGCWKDGEYLLRYGFDPISCSILGKLVTEVTYVDLSTEKRIEELEDRDRAEEEKKAIKQGIENW